MSAAPSEYPPGLLRVVVRGVQRYLDDEAHRELVSTVFVVIEVVFMISLALYFHRRCYPESHARTKLF